MKISKEERFEIYAKALDICENFENQYRLVNPCLCILLPCIKCNLNHNIEMVTLGLDYEDTVLDYPEIKPFVDFVDSGNYKKETLRTARIEFLKTLLSKS